MSAMQEVRIPLLRKSGVLPQIITMLQHTQQFLGIGMLNNMIIEICLVYLM